MIDGTGGIAVAIGCATLRTGDNAANVSTVKDLFFSSADESIAEPTCGLSLSLMPFL